MAADAPSSPSSPPRGLTLIEVLVVVALLAVLASLAAPSFSAAIERQRLRHTANELIDALRLARMEAQRTGQNVVLRRNEPCAANAQPDEWRCGWSMFVDLDRDHVQDSAEPLLQQATPTRSTWVQRRGLAAQGPYIEVNRFGGLPVGLGLAIQAAQAAPGEGIAICTGGNRLRVDESGSCL